MNKFVCIHGHFYQPPRDNPWLNTVEIQDSAYPFHDWNQRITSECYARNAASRILDDQNRIIDIVNNYGYISYNFGPTLLEWMEKESPEAYQVILNADKESQTRFSGHGSAIAQAYNHMIMPLANDRDKETQIIWGIKDFESRFERMPEGMWCGETAINTTTLELMAKHGIKFTILSPMQCKTIRRKGDLEWTDVSGGKVDSRRPYLCRLPSGNEINLFFYDGKVSQAIAFEHLLESGEQLADRLISQISEHDTPELIHIATDGESYGHHHQYGEMALSYCLYKIEKSQKANVTIYGEYLEKFPPEYEAEVLENSSWSCSHGVERWKNNCGCNSNIHEGWNQQWRAPLRDSFDWIRDQLIPLYEKEMSVFVQDPWKLRDDYISVIRDRSEDHVTIFLTEHTGRKISQKQKVKMLKLLEMQFHAMLMYTSCGWFFDEVTGLESMQDILYAARALQLAKDITGTDYEEEFIRLLEKAPSNIATYGNAANAYKKFIQPAVTDLLRVGAHYAVSSLFTSYPELTSLYCYQVHSTAYELYQAGKYKLAVGRAHIRSSITWEEEEICFAVVHLGEHQLYGGVSEFRNDEAFQQMHEQMKKAFDEGNVQEVLLLMDKHYGTHHYSFWHLFRDDQKRIVNQVLDSTLLSVEGMFTQIYENNYPLMKAIYGLSMPLPKPFKLTADFIVNNRLKKILESERLDMTEYRNLKEEVSRLKVDLDTVTLNHIAGSHISSLMEKLSEDPTDVNLLSHIIELIQVTQEVPLKPDLWKARNIAFLIRSRNYDQKKNNYNHNGIGIKNWREKMDTLFSLLHISAVEIEIPSSVYDLETGHTQN